MLDSDATTDISPRGREAGENPAQSRYGDRPFGAEVRSPTRGACSNLREKGRQDRAIPRLTPPSSPSKRGVSRSRATPSGPVHPGGPARPVRRRSPTRAPHACSPVAAVIAACSPGRAAPSARAADRRHRPRRRQRRPGRRRRRPTLGRRRSRSTLTDDEGTVVDASPAEPQRIVSLTPAVDRDPVRASAPATAVVGKDADFDDYPPEAAAMPDVATYPRSTSRRSSASSPTSSSPAATASPRPTPSTSCASLGMPVVVVYAPDIDGVLSDIELIGSGDRPRPTRPRT